jgi:hypothetical protein
MAIGRGRFILKFEDGRRQYERHIPFEAFMVCFFHLVKLIRVGVLTTHQKRN